MNTLHSELWEKVFKFEFENEICEYGFETRLANENRWSEKFAQKAILEYKKFMFLATVSESMVSPSEIVDIVWHQHLIFTESYEQFAKVLNKRIAHIPAEHKPNDSKRFKNALQNTKELYESYFGEIPNEIWNEKEFLAKIISKDNALNNITFLKSKRIIVLTFILVTAIICELSRPIFLQISGNMFLLFSSIILISIWIIFKIYRTNYYSQITEKLYNEGLNELNTSELLFLKLNSIEGITNGVMNKLMSENKIIKFDFNRLELNTELEFIPENKYELAIKTDLELYDRPIDYQTLRNSLKHRKPFSQIANTCEFVKSKLYNSVYFHKYMSIYLAVMSVFVTVCGYRMYLGFLRGKPITFLAIITFTAIGVVFYKYKYGFEKLFNKILPNEFLKYIKVPHEKQTFNDWQNEYFILGPAVLLPAFANMQYSQNYNKSSSDSNDSNCSSGSSCSSDSGSSCGSGCGGCGGD